MTALLIETDGRTHLYDGESATEEDVLREFGAEGQIVNMQVQDADVEFAVWMAIDPAQPVNTHARHAIVNLVALHLMCFGPVLLANLDDDLARELAA